MNLETLKLKMEKLKAEICELSKSYPIGYVIVNRQFEIIGQYSGHKMRKHDWTQEIHGCFDYVLTPNGFHKLIQKIFYSEEYHKRGLGPLFYGGL